jgi:hypothetical protein
MSSDFSIKPIGSPVAASFVAPVSEAASKAVPTELPVRQSVAAIDKSTEARIDAPNGDRSLPPTGTARDRAPLPAELLSHQVIVDRDAAAIVYRVLDSRTSTVVQQFPDEAMLRRRAYFHALDRNRDVPAPVPALATDRSA